MVVSSNSKQGLEYVQYFVMSTPLTLYFSSGKSTVCLRSEGTPSHHCQGHHSSFTKHDASTDFPVGSVYIWKVSRCPSVSVWLLPIWCLNWPWCRNTRILLGHGLLATLGEYLWSYSPELNWTYPDIGDQHRKQRKMLNPVFSIKHMREMGESLDLTTSLVIILIVVPTFYGITHKVISLAECPR